MERFEVMCPAEAFSVHLDLKDAREEGVAFIFRLTQKILGRQNFPRLNKILYRLQDSSPVNLRIQDNTLSGQQNQIQVILQANSLEERQDRLMKIQEAFFEDLQHFKKPIVFILDTFNLATEELARWVEVSLFMEVKYNANLRVVVAGQKVPEPSGVWRKLHHCCRLNSITDLNEWFQYAKDVGYSVRQIEELRLLVYGLDGFPKGIAMALETAERMKSRYE
jgi:hypothetical protein